MSKKAVLIDIVRANIAAHDYTLEEFGALSALTFLAAQSGGALPDDDRVLARALRVDLRVWKRIRDRIEGHWFSRAGSLVGIGNDLIFVGKRRPIPKLVAEVVRKRDGDVCRYCKTTEGPFEFDHIYPRGRGGADTIDNLCVSCVPCNRAKADRTPEEMGWVR